MADLLPVRRPTHDQTGSTGWRVDEDALGGLLRVARPHERMGWWPSPSLLLYSLITDGVLLIIVALAAQFDPSGVRTSGLFPVGGNIPADLIGFLQMFTWPLLLLAVAGLALNVWCRIQRTPGWAHTLLALQVIPTAAASLGWFVVGLIFVIAIALWIAFMALVVAAVIAIVAAAIAGASS